jgi:sodium/pantothenate symporter
LLSASLFVPTIAGLWWKKANLVGGVGALVAGAAIYVLVYFEVVEVGMAPVVAALLASTIAMALGGYFGPQESSEMMKKIEALHDPGGP